MRLFLGQRAWLLQRFCAAALLILVTLAGARLLFGPPLTFHRWHELASSAHGAVLIVVFFAALCLHGWIGARDIVLDYVHPLIARLTLLALVAVILIAVLIRVALIVAAQFVAVG